MITIREKYVNALMELMHAASGKWLPENVEVV